MTIAHYLATTQQKQQPEKPRPKVIYLSGPIRDPRGAHFVEANIRAAEAVAKHLWQKGYAVICPHTNTRAFDGIITDDEFIVGDIAILERCDAVVMLPGWKASEGAKKEFEAAVDLGVPVFHWADCFGLAFRIDMEKGFTGGFSHL